MFIRVSILVSALTLIVPIVSAVPTFGGPTCSTGTIMKCCESVAESHNQNVQNAAAAIGIPVDSLTFPVGLHCSPISGLGGNSCNTQTACCSDREIVSFLYFVS
ncbi:hypothetical protein AX15_001216 [Amanita polypyramis BW_CC]|nr:hypothetical protein AX15_001216 [Amanita polypyramis BW_CC]